MTGIALFADKSFPFMRGTRLSSGSSYYIIEDFIGEGCFGKVARCFKSGTNEMVAVKISKEKIAAEDENTILRELKAFDPDRCNFVRWESSFTYLTHVCQEFELLDISLSEFVKRQHTSSLPLKEIRPILHQVATALTVLKDLRIVHADLKPENIMLVNHAQQPLKVKVIDFGSAIYISETMPGLYAQTRFYRAPETILGLPYYEAMDMWSLGCIAVELLMGFPLFAGSCEYDMIWKITKTLGELPQHLLNAALYTPKFYLNCGQNVWRLKMPHEYGCRSWCFFRSLDILRIFQRTPDTQSDVETVVDIMAGEADMENFVELVKYMLHLTPAERITPSQVLEHSFITMHHLLDSLDSSYHVQSCFDVMDICHSKRPSPDQDKAVSTKEPPVEDQKSTQELTSTDQESTSFSSVAQRLRPLYRDDQPALIHKLPLKRTRVEDRSLNSSSPQRKREQICEERAQFKKHDSQILRGSESISENSLPVKRKRNNRDTEEKDSAVTPCTAEGASFPWILRARPSKAHQMRRTRRRRSRK